MTHRGSLPMRALVLLTRPGATLAFSVVGLLLAPMIPLAISVFLVGMPVLQMVNMLGIFFWMWVGVRVPGVLIPFVEQQAAKRRRTVAVTIQHHALVLPDQRHIPLSAIKKVWDDINITLELADGTMLKPFPQVVRAEQRVLTDQLLAALRKYQGGDTREVPASLRALARQARHGKAPPSGDSSR